MTGRLSAWVTARRPGPNFWAGLFFLALTLVVLRDVLLTGGVLASTDSLYYGPPFKGVAPRGWKEGSNGLLGDSPYYFQPMWEMVRERLREGKLPLWNPLISSGAPLLANQQSAPFSVVNLPLWGLPFESGLAASAGLRLWLAGFGTHLLARRLGLGQWPALAAGTGYALGAYSIVWLSHGHMHVMALLPWALLTAHALAERPTPARALGHGVVLGLTLLGGHPESETFVGLAVWLFFVTTLVVEKRRGRELRRRLLAMAAASTLALLLAAVAIVPFLVELAGSVDRSVRGGDRVAPRESLLTLFFPDWWGRPTEGSDLGPANYNERTFYAGAVLLVGVPIALLQRRLRRSFAPVAVLGLFALLASTDATQLSEPLGQLPLLNQTTRGRLSVFIVLAVALLGAAGLDAVVRRKASGRELRVVLGAALAVGAVALVLLQPVGAGAWSDGMREAVGLSGFSQDRLLLDLADPSTRAAFDSLRVAAILRWTALVGGVTLLILAGRKGILSSRWLAPALTLVVVLDLATFANHYQPVVPKAEFYRPVPGSVEFLRRRQGNGRSVATGTTFGSNVNMHFGLRDARALDHPTPLRTFNFWRASLNREQGPIDALTVPAITPRAARDLSLMAVSHVMTAPGEAVPPQLGFRRVYDGPDADVWLNGLALPRAYSTTRAELAANASDALRRVTAPTFEARRTAVVEGPEATDPAGPRSKVAPVPIARDEPERVDLRADLDRPGLVVLADTYGAGWQVTVDGREAEPLRANYLYRAVAVPAGRHVVSWRYRPRAVAVGLGLSGLAVVLSLLLAASLVLRWRGRPARGETDLGFAALRSAVARRRR